MAEVRLGRDPSGDPAAAEPERAIAVSHPSLAFPHLTELLRRGPRGSILDLGPAIGENVAFLSALPSRVFVADLPSTLFAEQQQPQLTASAALAALLAAELGSLGLAAADAILAWDLLNYLTLEQIRILGRELADRCRPGARLYFLISTQHRIPARPCRFRIEADDRLVYEPTSRRDRSGPEYREPELLRQLPDFRVDTTFLLRHGIQEYLLARERRPGESDSGAPGG